MDVITTTCNLINRQIALGKNPEEDENDTTNLPITFTVGVFLGYLTKLFLFLGLWLLCCIGCHCTTQ